MELKRLGDYVDIKTGKLDANASNVNGEYPFFTCSINNLWIDTYAYDCECVLIAGNGDLNVKYYIGKFNAYQRTYIVESKDNKKLYTRYLFYFMSKYVDILRSNSIGGVIKYIKLADLTEVFIPLPSLETQKRIAEVLDKAQALIDARKEQIRLMDELIKAQFIEMFGDPVTNPKSWKKCRLENYISFMTSGSRGWSNFFQSTGEMFLTIKNVKDNKISLENIQYVKAPKTREAERTKVKEGDLLISITADLGRTGVVNEEIASYGAYINQHLSLLRLNDESINPVYVSYFLESQAGKIQFEGKNQNGVKAGLNFNAIKSLELLVPPQYIQEEFVNFVNRINESKYKMKKSLDEIEGNYNALMAHYFYI